MNATELQLRAFRDVWVAEAQALTSCTRADAEGAAQAIQDRAAVLATVTNAEPAFEIAKTIFAFARVRLMAGRGLLETIASLPQTHANLAAISPSLFPLTDPQDTQPRAPGVGPVGIHVFR